MKIVIDECLPKRLIKLIQKADVKTVPQLGLAGTKDKELLTKLEELQVDIFITIDGNCFNKILSNEALVQLLFGQSVIVSKICFI